MGFKFNRTDKAVEYVAVGEVVMLHGYLWLVLANTFDPIGNTGSQRRHVLTVDSADGKAPMGYLSGIQLGVAEHAFVTVVG